MTFLETSEKMYLQFRPVMDEYFPGLASRAAFGAVGRGSEFFSFDDELSRDHDYEDGFCIFLSEEDDLRYGVALSRLYRECFPSALKAKSAYSSKRLGVMTTEDFYTGHIGIPGAPESIEEWMYIPSYALAEATNGRVFEDSLGVFSGIREEILHGMPEDVRRKKIAARCALAAQSGQYNLVRCIKHGEKASAHIACCEFVKESAELVFLLNRAHAPYYKWIFRAMSSLDILSGMKDELENLFELPLESKAGKIEEISSVLIAELKRQNLSASSSDYLEDHAYSVQSSIENNYLRNLHIMEG